MPDHPRIITTTIACVARRANHAIGRSSPRRKKKSLCPSGKSVLELPPSHPLHEGRIAIVTDVGVGCGGRGGVGRERDGRVASAMSDRAARRRPMQLRTAKACGSGTRCWCQIGGGFGNPTGFAQDRQFADDGDKKEFVAEESAP
jgi:hypothetical protein